MEGKTAKNKCKDKANLTLRKGESQRPNGGYDYRWMDGEGKRRSLYAKTSEELREAEAQLQQDQHDGIKTEARTVTLNDMYELWKKLKRGLKDNTFQNYQYMYRAFVKPSFGKKGCPTCSSRTSNGFTIRWWMKEGFRFQRSTAFILCCISCWIWPWMIVTSVIILRIMC